MCIVYVFLCSFMSFLLHFMRNKVYINISSNTFHRRKWFVFVIICNQIHIRERGMSRRPLDCVPACCSKILYSEGHYWYLHKLSVFFIAFDHEYNEYNRKSVRMFVRSPSKWCILVHSGALLIMITIVVKFVKRHRPTRSYRGAKSYRGAF